MLPVNVVQNLSNIAERVFDQTLTLNRPTNTTGTWGTTAESFTLVAANVPCLVGDPKGGKLGSLPNIIGEEQMWPIQVQAKERGGPDVRINDQVIVGGRTMRVQNVGSPQSYGLTLGFHATEVR